MSLNVHGELDPHALLAENNPETVKGSLTKNLVKFTVEEPQTKTASPASQ